MNDLKFHWSNPKFAGLPWPADKREKKIRYKRRRCVKKPFSLAEVKAELAMVRKEVPGFVWQFKYCAACQGFHIYRVWERR